MWKGLKILRAGMAVLMLTAVAVFFLDVSRSLPLELHLLMHVQIVPLILAAGLLGLTVWLIVSLLFGRIYCSVICPLGIIQDGIARVGALFGKYKYTPPFVRLRNGFLLFFIGSLVVSFVLQFPLFVTLLDPYGIFGRMITSLVRPFYLFGYNFLVPYFQSTGYHTVTFQPIYFNVGITVVSLLMLMLIGTLAFRFGRRYCNTICPVGTLLGRISRYSVFRFRLHQNCSGCGICASKCKSECIDYKNKTIDMSRCVVCFNCLTICKKNAIGYTLPLGMNCSVEKQKPTSLHPDRDAVSSHRSHRRLLLLALLAPFFFRKPQIAIAATENASTVPDVLPQGKSRVSYRRENAVLPPGAISSQHFHARCTACQLCATKCPTHIIFPANNEYGLRGFMQPTLRFDNAYCQFDCTICTEICPSRALRKLSVAEKHQTQIGIAKLLIENCVVVTQGTHCAACEEHCPVGALHLEPYGDPEKHLTIPVLTPEFCIGCGACEYICPVRPYRAIYVEGNRVHQVAKLSFDPDEKQPTIELDDFGF